MAQRVRSDGPRTPRVRGRVPAPQIPNTAPLAVTAQPVNTTVQPRRVPTTNTATQLAQALGTLNPMINRVMDRQLAERESEAQSTAQNAAEARIAGMTRDEARQAIEEGNLPEFADPFFRAAFNYRYGERLAIWRANERLQEYGTGFDRDQGSLDAFFADGVNEDLGPDVDAHVQRGYLARMTPFADRLRANLGEYRTERLAEETRAGVYETFLQSALDNIQLGASPAEVARVLRAGYASNEDLLNVPRREQDEILVDVAARLAEDGHEGVVRELLFGDRGGVGSIGNTRRHAGRASDILTRAIRAGRERTHQDTFNARMGFFDQSRAGALDRQALTAFHQANQGALTDAQVQGLIARNDRVIAELRDQRLRAEEDAFLEGIYNRSRDHVLMSNLTLADSGLAATLRPREVFDRSGNRTMLSVDQQESQLIQAYLERSQIAAQQTGEDPAATFNREAEWFSSNGLVNPQWRQVLMQGATAATPASLSGDTIPPALTTGLELFRQLHAKNPALLRRHVTNDDAYLFYDAVQIGMTFAGLDEQTAITQAFQATRDRETLEGSVLMRRRYQDIEQEVDDLDSSWWDGWGTVRNVNAVGPQIERIARYYALVAGMSADDSLARAAELVQSTHSYINGYAVYTADQRIGNPDQFADDVEAFIADFVTRSPDLGLEAAEVTIVPWGAGFGSWLLVDSTSGDVVGSWRDNIVTLDRLAEFRAVERDQAITRIGEEAAGRLDPILATDIPVDITIGPIRWPWQQPFTEDELAEIERRGDAIRADRQRRREDILQQRTRETELLLGGPPEPSAR